MIHSWHAMHSIKSETTFQKYFDKDYDFLQVKTVLFIMSLFFHQACA